jgi:imidazolonepropionase-like amidohydrolase
VAGSDAGSYGVPHGLGLLQELELMEQAGLPPVAVLNSVTGVSAAHLAFREPTGRIARGYASRFIVTEHGPALSVSGLRHARIVIFDGAVVSGEDDHEEDLLGL